MDKIDILDSDNSKEKIESVVNNCNVYQQHLEAKIATFKDLLFSMQKNLEIMHCEIDNVFSSNDYVLSSLISNINELEDEIKRNGPELIAQKNNKIIAYKINILDQKTIELSEEINDIFPKMQNKDFYITDKDLFDLEKQCKYLLCAQEEIDAVSDEDISEDLVQQRFDQAQKSKPIYDELALQINSMISKHRNNKHALEILSNINVLIQNIDSEIDFILARGQNIAYEEMQQNIDILIKNKDSLEENKKYLDEIEFDASLDWLIKNRSDALECICTVDGKINANIDNYTALIQSELKLNDLINDANDTVGDLTVCVDKVSEKINQHAYESVDQMQEEFDWLIKQTKLLDQQKNLLTNHTDISSENTSQKKNQALRNADCIKEKAEALSEQFKDEVQKIYYAKNVINNFRDFIVSLEQEISSICIKIKNNEYSSVCDGVNELISKQQNMQDRQIELNAIKENLIPSDLLKKKIETSRKFIDIQEKISHFLLDIKIFNGM